MLLSSVLYSEAHKFVIITDLAACCIMQHYPMMLVTGMPIQRMLNAQ
jgi:hypothetical protein